MPISNKNVAESQNQLTCVTELTGVENNGISVDVIKTIVDPEKPQTLEDLDIVNENDIFIQVSPKCCILGIQVTPTVSHCSLATLIGLSIRSKLEKYWGKDFKIDVSLKEGTHQTVAAINKQINDKERIAAAMENHNIKFIVEKCITEEEGA